MGLWFKAFFWMDVAALPPLEELAVIMLLQLTDGQVMRSLTRCQPVPTRRYKLMTGQAALQRVCG